MLDAILPSDGVLPNSIVVTLMVQNQLAVVGVKAQSVWLGACGQLDRHLIGRKIRLPQADLAAGQRVYLDWVSVNRDPEVFGDPDAYRPEENADKNVVYGLGKHVCPGRDLSTMELRAATTELLARTTAIVPAPGQKNVRETIPLAGFRSVHVILHKQ